MTSSTIVLSDGTECLVDSEDHDWLSQFRWSPSMTKTTGPYAHAWVNGRLESMHRLLMGLPPQQVDHRNGNTLDNRKCNLRTATHAQNAANQKVSKSNKSGVKGVYREGNKWVACIKVNYRSKYLGSFDEIGDAAAAYESAAREHFGEFASESRV